MMTKKRSKTLAKTRYIWSLPLLLILFFISFGSQAIAQGTPIIAEESVDTVYTVNAETYEETVAITRTTIYKNQDLDRNAVLKSCEAAGDAEEQGLCSTNKLISTVYNGIKYPTEAKKAGIEGMVLVKINVLTSGKGEYSILKDPGYGMGPEVIRVLSSAELQWNTAELNKKPVVSQLIFPVKFKLQK